MTTLAREQRNFTEDGLKVLADRNEEPRRRVEIEQRMAHVNEALQS